MEVMFDRVAGLDVGKESVTVCVRTPGPRGGRRSETRTFKTMTGSLRVMRDWLVEAGVSDRGDGVDLDVLEAAVLLPRGGDGGVAAERRAHEGRARPQERCSGRGVDRAVAGARVVGAVVRAAAGDSSAADADPVSGAADGGPGPGDRPVGADVGRRVDQVVVGRVESEDGVGPGDPDRDDQRRIGSVAAGRYGEGSDAAQDPRSGPGVDRTLRRQPCPAGPVDAASAGSGRAGAGRAGRGDRRGLPAVGAPDRAAANHSRRRAEGRGNDRRRDRRAT